MEGTEDGQLGPGFFIFFRQPGGSKINKPLTDRFKKIKQDDEEILLFIKTILTKGLI